MLKYVIASFILASSVTVEVNAQSELDTAARNATDAALAPVDPFAAERSVEAQIQKFLASNAGQSLQTGNGKVWSAVATVTKSTRSGDWGMLRSLAYQRAWTKVQQDYIRWQFEQSRNSTVRRLFEDASSGAPAYEQAKYTGSDTIDEFIDKSGAYISSKLDAALLEAGVDPEAYARGSKKQRKDLLVDSITQTTVTRSFGTLAGLWSVQTFSGAVDGQEAIGVVGAYSPAFRELAGEISGRRPIQSTGASGAPLAQRIPTEPGSLLGAFGVRVLHDEEGYPLLLAFGQSAMSRTKGSAAVLSSARNTAIGRARSAADAAMAQFVNGTAVYENENTLGDSVREYVEVDRQGSIELSEGVDITAIYNESLSSSSKSTLSGKSVFTTWTYMHPPTKQMLVGVVVAWSPAEDARARFVKNGRRIKASEKPVGEDVESNEPEWSVNGPNLFDIKQ